MYRQTPLTTQTYHPPKPNKPNKAADLPKVPVVTGPTCADINGSFFHSAFFTQLPAPPLGPLDPCFKSWAESTFFAYWLQMIRNLQPQHSAICTAVLEQYFDACRDYANDLEKWWGKFFPKNVKYLYEIDGPIPYVYDSATTAIS